MWRRFLERLLGGHGDGAGYDGSTSSVPEIDASTGALAIAVVIAALLLARHLTRNA